MMGAFGFPRMFVVKVVLAGDSAAPAFSTASAGLKIMASAAHIRTSADIRFGATNTFGLNYAIDVSVRPAAA